MITFSKSGTGTLAVILSSVLFCSKAIWVKKIYEYDIEPVILMTLRMFLALPFFLIPVILSRVRQNESRGNNLNYRQLIQIGTLGLLGYYMASYMDLQGLKYIPASVERVILYLYPTFVALLSWIIFRKKVSKTFWVALFICYAGLCLMFVDNSILNNELALKGVFLVFGSALAYAIFLIANESLVKSISPGKLANVTMLWSSLFILIHFLIFYKWDMLKVPLPVLGYVTAIAIFATVIPIRLLTYGLKQLGASRTAVLSSLGPISTAFFGWSLLGETFKTLQLVGMAIVVLGGIPLSIKSKG